MLPSLRLLLKRTIAQGRFLSPLIFEKGGCQMVTYSDLIQLGILIVDIIALFLQVNKKK